MEPKTDTGSTAGRSLKRGLRGFFLGALSLWAAKKGLTLPIPGINGDAAQAAVQAINIGVSLALDKAARELWAKIKK